MKVLFGMALRQTTGFVESLLCLIGLDWKVPDWACDTRKCHDAIAGRGAAAVIPPRKTAKPWKAVTAGAVARNEALRASKRVARTIWRRWSGDHRRSRAEI